MDFRDPTVDFVGIARSLGVRASRVTDGSELRSALSSAIERRRTELIEVEVNGAI